MFEQERDRSSDVSNWQSYFEYEANLKIFFMILMYISYKLKAKNNLLFKLLNNIWRIIVLLSKPGFFKNNFHKCPSEIKIVLIPVIIKLHLKGSFSECYVY